MIPLKDKNPTKRFPIVTVILIALNILMYIYEISLGIDLENFLFQYSIIPSNIIHIISSNLLSFITFITSMFLHSGWIHLIGNMVFLWVFGDNVEDKFGRFRFLLFYIICGISASTLHVLIDPRSTVPMIGASGAISGVLGAYLFLFPKAKIVTIIPIFIFIQIVELPAYILIGF
jgi:membrane associated rhomboid family serine protease